VLLDGVNHRAVLTRDTERLSRFSTQIFESPPARAIEQQPGFKLSLIDIGAGRELNVFEIDGHAEVDRRTPMFGRGRLDHVGFQAASIEAFEEIRRRLIACGAADDFVTDFGPVLSLFFTDPDGLEGEVVVADPDAAAGVSPPSRHARGTLRLTASRGRHDPGPDARSIARSRASRDRMRRNLCGRR
jgi:catechol 2,3-dioxygenase-like lactoylglutathione lyase family enzyme